MCGVSIEPFGTIRQTTGQSLSLEDAENNLLEGSSDAPYQLRMRWYRCECWAAAGGHEAFMSAVSCRVSAFEEALRGPVESSFLLCPSSLSMPHASSVHQDPKQYLGTGSSHPQHAYLTFTFATGMRVPSSVLCRKKTVIYA